MFLIFGRFLIILRSLASSDSSSSAVTSHFERFRELGVEEPGRFCDKSDMDVHRQSRRGEITHGEVLLY